MNAKRILVLGASGILGSAVFRRLSVDPALHVSGTVRNHAVRRAIIRSESTSKLIVVRDLSSLCELNDVFANAAPDIVINCLAVRRPIPVDPMVSFLVHAVIPRRVADICRSICARLIHISTDGVFTGTKGSYVEDDIPDATDLYGLSKLLGEVSGGHVTTLRTSVIGHELYGQSALLEWFLAQERECRGYTRAIFSGFPAPVLADILREHVIPNMALSGLFHVASEPISKYDLLGIIARRYGKTIRIIPDDSVLIDRSLVANRFAKMTGYCPPDWPTMVDFMYCDKFGSGAV